LVLFNLGLVFLGLGHGHCAALFGFGLEALLVGLGLGGLELGADVLADVDVGDIDGENLEGAAGVKAFGHDGLGDVVGVLQHGLVGLGRADGGDDALADAGDDGLFGGAADKAGEVGADGDAGLGL